MNEQDEPETMESYLDLSNTIYSDYLQGWTVIPDAHKRKHQTSVFAPKTDTTIMWDGDPVRVMNRSAPGPEITEDMFLIGTADGGLATSIRPIRDHEVLRLLGYPPDFYEEEEFAHLDAKLRVDLIRNLIPKHTLQRIVSVLQLAERRAQEDQSLSEQEATTQGPAGMRPELTPVEPTTEQAQAAFQSKLAGLTHYAHQKWPDGQPCVFATDRSHLGLAGVSANGGRVRPFPCEVLIPTITAIITSEGSIGTRRNE